MTLFLSMCLVTPGITFGALFFLGIFVKFAILLLFVYDIKDDNVKCHILGGMGQPGMGMMQPGMQPGMMAGMQMGQAGMMPGGMMGQHMMQPGNFF